MATVSFKKGLLANLPVAMSEGTLYVTTDERALYLDIDNSTRIRNGMVRLMSRLTWILETFRNLPRWPPCRQIQIPALPLCITSPS